MPKNKKRSFGSKLENLRILELQPKSKHSYKKKSVFDKSLFSYKQVKPCFRIDV